METYLFCELEDLILLEWQYSPNWSMDSTQSLSKFQYVFCRNGQNDPKIHVENASDPNYPKEV